MPKLNESTLLRLFKSRAYPLPAAGEVIIFGLRSFTPGMPHGTDVEDEVEIRPAKLDYEKVRCTLGLWKVGTGIAIYPGSTVPKGSAALKHSSDPWGKVNQMVPGYYPSYKLGQHGAGTAHRAVRQVRPVMVRRSDDGDAVYELTDPIYVDKEGYKENGKTLAGADSLVSDNIHCGRYYQGDDLIPETSYSAVGCQVIAGSTDGTVNGEAGPWKKFIRKLYGDASFQQNNYAYALFSPEETAAALSHDWGKAPVEITYGSYHESAKVVQQALFAKGYYHGDLDGDFRQRSVTALLAFERASLPGGGASGRTTPVIQDLLGISLPAADSLTLLTAGKLAVTEEPVVGEPPKAIVVDEAKLAEELLVSAVPFMHPEEAVDLKEDPSLYARLDVNHSPISWWQIGHDPSSGRYTLRHDQQPQGLYLGKEFGYPKTGPTTVGLARTSSAEPRLDFRPEDWVADFGRWPELLFPTSWAESNANFLVVNAWDAAAMTFGFIQLAAHTPDDLIPLMRRLVAELPGEAKVWFPELAVVNGVLCFRRDGKYKSLENARQPDDGASSSSWYRGDFMQFLNPSRKRVDKEELHAAARWIEWSRMSRDMRRIQVDESIRNMKDSVSLLHRALLKDASSRYPSGVDGMRCDHLAAAIAVPHLSPSKIGKAVWALKQSDVLQAFHDLEYGPGTRESSVVAGVKKRGTNLSSLRYSLSTDEPV